MRAHALLQSLVVAALIAATVHAQSIDSARLASAIAPLVDDQTLLVAHVDLKVVDTAAGAAKLIEAFQFPNDVAGMFSASAATLGEHLKQLKQQGVSDFFFLVNIADLPTRPVMIVVPLAGGADTTKIVAALNVPTFLGGKTESAQFENNLVIAARESIERVRGAIAAAKGKGAVPRPEIAEAFKAVENSAAQLLIVPSATTRRVIEEMLPTLPQFAGGGSTKAFTSGARWMAIGVTIPPQPVTAKVVLQAADAQSAATLVRELAQLTAALGKEKQVLALIPKFEDLSRHLVPTVNGDRLTLDWNEANGGLKAAVALLGPPIEDARDVASNARSLNNLKQIGLAMHNYHDKHKTFPPRAILSKDGKPLLSSRMALLPYLDGNAVFNEFHLDEPWDSEHNRRLIERMPATLRSPNSSAAAGRTTYLAPILPGGVFGGAEGMPIKEITDGLSNTILVVEGDDDHAVVWTKPDDVQIDVNDAGKGLVTGLRKWMNALMGDGSALSFPNPTAADVDKKGVFGRFTAHDGTP